MDSPAGYLLNRKDGLVSLGGRGVAYDYILAGNGLWIEAEGRLLAARVLVAPAQVRGLAPLEPKVALRYGSIPQGLWDLALNAMLADPSREMYIAITWGGDSYHLQIPEQKRGAGGVSGIQLPENRVMDLHSHCGMRAYFSSTDNQDEQGLQLYAVVGELPHRPVVRLRMGIYAYFQEIPWAGVFHGELTGATDALHGKYEIEVLEETDAFSEWWTQTGLAKLLAKLEWADPEEKAEFLKLTGVVGNERLITLEEDQ